MSLATLKINRQTQIAYADQDALDKGRIENSTTIYDSYVSFCMKCGFELVLWDLFYKFAAKKQQII